MLGLCSGIVQPEFSLSNTILNNLAAHMYLATSSVAARSRTLSVGGAQGTLSVLFSMYVAKWLIETNRLS